MAGVNPLVEPAKGMHATYCVSVLTKIRGRRCPSVLNLGASYGLYSGGSPLFFALCFLPSVFSQSSNLFYQIDRNLSHPLVTGRQSCGSRPRGGHELGRLPSVSKHRKRPSYSTFRFDL